MRQGATPIFNSRIFSSAGKALAGGLLLSLLGTAAAAAEGGAEYLYNLANFTGNIPFDGAKVALDESTGEIYVPSSTQNVVIFNANGMEVYRFGDDDRLGSIFDMGAPGDGSVLLLSYFPTLKSFSEWEFRLVRCDYRGEPVETVALQGLPAGFERFQPNRMFLKNGLVYLVSDNGMTAVAADLQGRVKKAWEFWKLAEIAEKDIADNGLGGFAAGADGTLVFSLPIPGKIVRVKPDGTSSLFGVRGSGPGKLGVPKGVGLDAKGNVYVVDILRRKVLVYDADLNFVQEFGSLRAPQEVAVTADGRVYVSQHAKRGVAVYQAGAAALGGRE